MGTMLYRAAAAAAAAEKENETLDETLGTDQREDVGWRVGMSSDLGRAQVDALDEGFGRRESVEKGRDVGLEMGGRGKWELASSGEERTTAESGKRMVEAWESREDVEAHVVGTIIAPVDPGLVTAGDSGVVMSAGTSFASASMAPLFSTAAGISASGLSRSGATQTPLSLYACHPSAKTLYWSTSHAKSWLMQLRKALRSVTHSTVGMPVTSLQLLHRNALSFMYASASIKAADQIRCSDPLGKVAHQDAVDDASSEMRAVAVSVAVARRTLAANWVKKWMYSGSGDQGGGCGEDVGLPLRDLTLPEASITGEDGDGETVEDLGLFQSSTV
ncbi:hypothetical protein HK101_006415 [Irineochytrium annulatum]|nr:hypothetical protein HK101_006415 [Irineochytrium annulatum]